jgi:hypothetical protein
MDFSAMGKQDNRYTRKMYFLSLNFCVSTIINIIITEFFIIYFLVFRFISAKHLFHFFKTYRLALFNIST